MSDDSVGLDLREQIGRIDRMREEALKFVAEQHKLAAEQSKLAAEAMKLRRDYGLAPWLLVVAGVGGVAGFAAAIVTVFRTLGHS